MTIDDYNEAELELAFMLLSLPAAARFILDNLKKHPQEKPAAPVANPPVGLGLTASTPSLTPQSSRLPTSIGAETLDTCPT